MNRTNSIIILERLERSERIVSCRLACVTRVICSLGLELCPGLARMRVQFEQQFLHRQLAYLDFAIHDLAAADTAQLCWL